MSEHSIYSPSGFAAAMACPGKPAMEHGREDKPTFYSAEGTVAHRLLEKILRDNDPLTSFAGTTVVEDGFDIVIGQDMVDHVRQVANTIGDMAGPEGSIAAEQRVNFATYLDVPEEEAWGTADSIVVRGTELQVHDLKYGMGVKVSAENNVQMMLYGLGSLQAFEGLTEFETVRLVIHQPRVNPAPSEWVISVADLEQWGRSTARSAAASRRQAWIMRFDTPIVGYVWEDTYLRPGEDQCRFCRAAAVCPKLRAEVAKTMFDSEPATADEFADLTPVDPKAKHDDGPWLSAVMGKAKMVEEWLKAVRAEVEGVLLQGGTIPGYKLVEGRLGNREWDDPAAAEKMLKETMRLKVEEMYDLKLISPTTAEKLTQGEKKAIGPRQWQKLQPLVVRKPGKASVAPASDPRPALTLTPVEDDFTDVSVADPLL